MKTRLNIDNFSIGQLKNIGNTSLVDLSSLSQNSTVRIYAKLEGENPTGSIKDRVAKCLIFDAEKEGKITPGQTIIEPTSGNTGIGLAMISKIKGYFFEGSKSGGVTSQPCIFLSSYDELYQTSSTFPSFLYSNKSLFN